MEMILQKIIAQSGRASRRQAEKMIRNGQIKINGDTAVLGMKADVNRDKITILGRPITAAPEKIYIKLNKPAGYTCTNRKFSGEKNIFDLVKTKERLFAVGRLDKDSCGLILLTNDGDLAQHLAHPRFQHEKVYEIVTAEKINNGEEIAKRMIRGLDIGQGDGIAKAKKAQHLQNNRFVITLTEGKKRQIRRMFEAQSIKISHLKRTKLGPLEIGKLAEGKWAFLTQEEKQKIKKYQ